MTGFLAINAMLEMLHVEAAHDRIIDKHFAICAEEIRNLALALNELTGKRLWQKPFVLPDIISPLKSTWKTDYFIRFSIGGIPFAENALNLQEVCYPAKADIFGDMFSLRGHKMPILDCFRRFDLPHEGFDENRQTVMVINPDYEKYHRYRDGVYAVPIDDLDINTIFQSRIGYAVSPKSDSIFADYSRECWDVVGGDQIIFLDWQKLIS